MLFESKVANLVINISDIVCILYVEKNQWFMSLRTPVVGVKGNEVRAIMITDEVKNEIMKAYDAYRFEATMNNINK